MLSRSLVLLVAIMGSLSLTAAPTTKPAAPGIAFTRPAAKVQPLSERDSVLVTNDVGKFKIRIPRDWKATEQNPGALFYEIAPTKRDGTRGGELYIVAGTLCHPGASLDEQVTSNIELWQKDYKGFKLLKQESVELAGVPAMAITYDREYELIFENGKTRKQTVISKKERSQAILCINGDKAYFAEFSIDSADFDMKLKLVNRVLASFEWLDASAATTQPTASAK